MAGTNTITRKEAVDVLTTLGFRHAYKNSINALADKLKRLPDYLSEFTGTFNGANQAIVDKIKSIIANGEEVVVSGNDPSNPVDDKPVRKKTRKKEGEAEVKTKTKKSAKEKTPAKPKANGKPGIIKSIAEYITSKPRTKNQVIAYLTTKFPERNVKSMTTTVGCQLGGYLESDKGYIVKKIKKGDKLYYQITGQDDKLINRWTPKGRVNAKGEVIQPNPKKKKAPKKKVVKKKTARKKKVTKKVAKKTTKKRPTTKKKVVKKKTKKKRSATK